LDDEDDDVPIFTTLSQTSASASKSPKGMVEDTGEHHIGLPVNGQNAQLAVTACSTLEVPESRARDGDQNPSSCLIRFDQASATKSDCQKDRCHSSESTPQKLLQAEISA
jgi:hypothetical protein